MPTGNRYEMNRIRARSAGDILIKSAILVTVFTSGGVNVINPFILGTVGLILMSALYIRDGIYIHRTMYKPNVITGTCENTSANIRMCEEGKG